MNWPSSYRITSTKSGICDITGKASGVEVALATSNYFNRRSAVLGLKPDLGCGEAPDVVGAGVVHRQCIDGVEAGIYDCGYLQFQTIGEQPTHEVVGDGFLGLESRMLQYVSGALLS